MGTRIVELQDEVDARNSWVQSVKQDLQNTENALAQYKQEAEELERTLRRETEEFRREMTDVRRELTDVRAHLAESEQKVRDQAATIGGLERRIAELNSAIASMHHIMRGKEADLALLRTELEEIKRSDFWKVASAYWRLRDTVLPAGSRRRRQLKSAFSLLKKGILAPRNWLSGKSPAAGRGTPPVADVQAIEPPAPAAIPEEPIAFPETD